ncbi:MAG: hypothetical protein U0270_16895 [Labilithrix sp.]
MLPSISAPSRWWMGCSSRRVANQGMHGGNRERLARAIEEPFPRGLIDDLANGHAERAKLAKPSNGSDLVRIHDEQLAFDASAVGRSTNALAPRPLDGKGSLDAASDEGFLEACDREEDPPNQLARRIISRARTIGADERGAVLPQLGLSESSSERLAREAVEALNDKVPGAEAGDGRNGLQKDGTTIKRSAARDLFDEPLGDDDAGGGRPSFDRIALGLCSERLTVGVGRDAKVGDRDLRVALRRLWHGSFLHAFRSSRSVDGTTLTRREALACSENQVVEEQEFGIPSIDRLGLFRAWCR